LSDCGIYYREGESGLPKRREDFSCCSPVCPHLFLPIKACQSRQHRSTASPLRKHIAQSGNVSLVPVKDEVELCGIAFKRIQQRSGLSGCYRSSHLRCETGKQIIEAVHLELPLSFEIRVNISCCLTNAIKPSAIISIAGTPDLYGYETNCTPGPTVSLWCSSTG
jgi:hypothetical protein